ncbi:MAG: Na+-transporting NADH:ubiquinone oxidoreductase subunit F [Candidatus Omnitrophota bacterium]|jgi:Na+-transporting NADH:ubiquinone oxidoreductase subunit F
MSNLIIILISIAVFTTTILALIGFLLLAASKLMPGGECKITINDDESKSPTVKSGGTLLSVLADQNVYLPSACGGGGTCAMCKCQVFEGGGDILPTETSLISRKEAKDHWRLSCQVKVKQDMKIGVPEEIFGIKKFTCTVTSNANVATFIKDLDLSIDDGVKLDFEAGQYIQIDIPAYRNSYKEFAIEEEYREDWDRFNLWQYNGVNPEEIFRAYSMANHPAEGNRVKLNVRIASPPPNKPEVAPGIASSYIFNLKPGDKCVLSGPYGDFLCRDTEREKIYVGGGAGMAPMRSHVFDLFHTRKWQHKTSFWYGARSVREMFYDDEFKAIESEFPNFKYHVALSAPLPEDKWNGKTGFIHQVLLNEYLSKHPEPEECEYYLCGPPMMIDAVTNMLLDIGVDQEMISFDSFG